jgi:hypothetical protein
LVTGSGYRPPMSSLQTCGKRCWNSRIAATQPASSSSTTSTPWERRKPRSPAKVRASPTTTAPGVAQGGDLAVRHRVALLDALVVPLAEHGRALGEDRPDRDATGLQALARLGQGQGHQFPV